MAEAADRIAAKIEALIERAMKMLALEIDRQLRKSGTGTPVDTGHARANWVPSVGSPFRGEATGTSSAEHDAGVGEVMSYRLGNGFIYISNNVPYIRRLNEGWSQQAPALFVEASIERAITIVKNKLGVDFSQSFRSEVGGAGAQNLARAFSPFGVD